MSELDHTAEGGAHVRHEIEWAIDAIDRGDYKLARNRLVRCLTGKEPAPAPKPAPATPTAAPVATVASGVGNGACPYKPGSKGAQAWAMFDALGTHDRAEAVAAAVAKGMNKTSAGKWFQQWKEAGL